MIPRSLGEHTISRMIYGVIFLAHIGGAAASEPYKLSLDSKNTIWLVAPGSEPTTISNSNKVTQLITGTRKCNNSVKPSSATAEANVSIIEKGEDKLTFDLLTKAKTTDYPCAGVLGGGILSGVVGMPEQPKENLVKSTSLSKASAVVVVKFDNNSPTANFIVDVNVESTGASPIIEIYDKSNKPVRPIEGSTKSFQILGEPNAQYSIKATLVANSSVSGDCCADNQDKRAKIDLTVRKAPMISSNLKLEPYIVGGNQTTAYKSVVAILIKGALHCTGTIVGKRTVLTAAHCLEGYDKQYSDFTVVVGSNVVQPSAGPIKVVGNEYPKGDPEGYKFERAALIDDIGLVYLEHDLDIQPVDLHSGNPNWNDIKAKGLNLTFVGFGYDMLNKEQVGLGVKREGSWHINGEIENRRVKFSIPGKNTCKGDSGGPAFLIENGSIKQVAITSGGAGDCSYGLETRIDAFNGWLAGKIR